MFPAEVLMGVLPVTVLAHLACGPRWHCGPGTSRNDSGTGPSVHTVTRGVSPDQERPDGRSHQTEPERVTGHRGRRPGRAGPRCDDGDAGRSRDRCTAGWGGRTRV